MIKPSFEGIKDRHNLTYRSIAILEWDFFDPLPRDREVAWLFGVWMTKRPATWACCAMDGLGGSGLMREGKKKLN